MRAKDHSHDETQCVEEELKAIICEDSLSDYVYYTD